MTFSSNFWLAKASILRDYAYFARLAGCLSLKLTKLSGWQEEADAWFDEMDLGKHRHPPHTHTGDL